MSDALHRFKDAAQTAFCWFAIGFAAAYSLAPTAPITGPIRPNPPAVQPAPAPAKVVHAGHFTISYIEPRYGSPASAAVRDGLASTDWKPLDCTFRAYTEGQDELRTLGFVKHFTSADLPVCFIQETTPAGAPLIGTPLKPASAGVVLTRVKELRGL